MTTAELIAQLQAADPTGELPVCVSGVDIYNVTTDVGYYDGPYEQLVHDPKLRGIAWSIIGAKLSTRGQKVVLHEMSICDVMVDEPDLPVEFDCDKVFFGPRVEEWRKAARELNGRLSGERPKESSHE